MGAWGNTSPTAWYFLTDRLVIEQPPREAVFVADLQIEVNVWVIARFITRGMSATLRTT